MIMVSFEFIKYERKIRDDVVNIQIDDEETFENDVFSSDKQVEEHNITVPLVSSSSSSSNTVSSLSSEEEREISKIREEKIIAEKTAEIRAAISSKLEAVLVDADLLVKKK